MLSYDLILAGPSSAEGEGEEEDESYSLFRQERILNGLNTF